MSVRIDDPAKDKIMPGRNGSRKEPTRITFMGETMTVKEWADDLGIDPRTILARIRKGLSVEKCLDKVDNRTTRQKPQW